MNDLDIDLDIYSFVETLLISTIDQSEFILLHMGLNQFLQLIPHGVIICTYEIRNSAMTKKVFPRVHCLVYGFVLL